MKKSTAIRNKIRWGMVIDLKKCAGCQTCTVACKIENGLGPNISRCRVVEKEMGKFPEVERLYISIRCMHCQEPECLRVCPSGATIQREDGIVTVDSKKCLGCRYCVVACPYQARTFWPSLKKYFPHGESVWEDRRYQEHEIGVVDKCDFCLERLEEGVKKSLKPGLDAEATPFCAIACIGKALYFGDLNDPESEVSRLIKERKGFQLRAELETDPSVYYLPRR